jgi:peptidoglycan/LPS O-acetylase OafA/YrhL
MVSAAAPVIESVDAPLPSAKHLPQLDGVRGIAILLVVACHYFWFPTVPALRQLSMMRAANLGWTGVDLFFVLSGFLLGGILIDQKGSEGYFRRFYLRRAARILPLYYSWLLISPFLAGWGDPDLAYLVFAQNWMMAVFNRSHGGGLFISWSLAVEEQFYLVLPFLISYLSRRGLTVLLIAFVALQPLIRVIALPLVRSATSILILPVTHGDGLAIGVLLAIALRNQAAKDFYRRYRRGIAAFAIGLAFYTATSLFYIGTNQDPRATPFFFPVALVYGWIVFECVAVPGSLAARFCMLTPLRFFGKISYCLYLTHWLVMLAIEQWAIGHRAIAFVTPGALLRFTVVCGALSLGIASALCWLSYRFFEQPILRWAARRGAGSPRDSAK